MVKPQLQSREKADKATIQQVCSVAPGLHHILVLVNLFPSGHHLDKWSLKLQKSLYGSRYAPHHWYEHLRSKLIQGLWCTQSKCNQCLFYGQDILIGIYVDDVIVVARTKNTLNDFIQHLRNIGFSLTHEGTLAEYLGINIRDKPNGTFDLMQLM
jgi:Reverse transcriptase (RNA-dependent DNA polymerase)